MQRYQKCLTCEKRGAGCDGPNLLTLSAPEIIEFCKSIRRIRGISVSELADGCGIPKGTIGRIFSTESTIDFRYETIRAIALYLCDCRFLGNPCPTPDGWEITHLEEQISRQKERITDLHDELTRTRGQYDNLLTYHKDYMAYIRKVIILLGVSIAVLASILITMLIIDATVPDLGFFFHRS